MTLFEELYALALTATLTMTVSADEKSGRLTLNVIPKPRKDVSEPTLTQPLSLTATPQEFDEGFIAALTGYREVRQSLTEQAEATKEVIEAAKTASVKKASEAVSKASKTAAGAGAAAKAATTLVAPAQMPPSEDDDEGAETSAAGATSAAPAATGGNSYDLFG
ncbi:PRTRC system protein E [Ottowia sp.]|jgi:PRTRC genetic system protein E|uniref:PRTRC system protein E n=1 Tax=Ottowia sp. TaxID=1898956 RepID=UPI00263469AA|nr:PRTRC system protein E [Ottowia sp.]